MESLKRLQRGILNHGFYYNLSFILYYKKLIISSFYRKLLPFRYFFHFVEWSKYLFLEVTLFQAHSRKHILNEQNNFFSFFAFCFIVINFDIVIKIYQNGSSGSSSDNLFAPGFTLGGVLAVFAEHKKISFLKIDIFVFRDFEWVLGLQNMKTA